jgi:hypothetical protein
VNNTRASAIASASDQPLKNLPPHLAQMNGRPVAGNPRLQADDRKEIIMGAPKMPSVPVVPPPPPLPPTISTAQVQAANTSYRANAAGAAGLGSTILSGPMGADQGVNYPGKALTGS